MGAESLNRIAIMGLRRFLLEHEDQIAEAVGKYGYNGTDEWSPLGHTFRAMIGISAKRKGKR